MSPSTFPLVIPRRWRLWLGAVGVAALAAACGGGGVDTGGTGGTATTFSSGRIEGFGSVIVNGVRFDDTNASITDDDGNTHSRGELKLGMVVEVTAGAVGSDDNGPVGTASQIQIVSEIKGPVEAVDAAGGSATVLGQSVTVDANTVYDGIGGGLSGLAVGDQVEVHAFFDAQSGRFSATLIEKKSGLSEFKLRGVVAGLDTGARTFRLGGATISYAGVAASELPSLTNGMPVRVTLQTTPQAGTWVATRVRGGDRQLPDDAEGELEGFVSDFASPGNFKVNGVTVDASGAGVVFEDGTLAGLANGVRLEVKGTVRNGVLVATKVEFKAADDEGDGEGHGNLEIELHGTIDSAAPGDALFVLRGVTVHVDAGTQFERGSVADLVAGASIEVKGQLISGSNDVLATRIKFEDD